MPIRDHMLPTPTLDSSVVVANLESPEFQVPYLASSAGMWHASLALDNQGPQGIFATSMLDSADRLSLELTREQVDDVGTSEAANRVVDALAEGIGQAYGEPAQDRFEAEYHATVATELLSSGPDMVATDELPILRHQAGLHMLNALGAATRMGADQTIVQDGQSIALPLLSRVETEGVAEQIERWVETVDYAYSGVPTPMPPPSEAEQAGTDITIDLPPGNRFRGELLHEQLGCSACHIMEAIAPQWRSLEGAENPGMLAVAEARWQDPNYTGQATSGVEYLIESTVLPDVYVVDPYEIALMSVDYSKQLSKQDLADIVAFLTVIGR